MNLFINSPSCYTQEFGVIDEIYQLCKTISLNIDVSLYTDVIDTIGIVPIIAPINLIEKGECRETKKISLTDRMACVSLHSNFEDFTEADTKGKKQIIIENILQSLYVVKVKLKGNFNYEQIKEDIVLLVQQHNKEFNT